MRQMDLFSDRIMKIDWNIIGILTMYCSTKLD